MLFTLLWEQYLAILNHNVRLFDVAYNDFFFFIIVHIEVWSDT